MRPTTAEPASSAADARADLRSAPVGDRLTVAAGVLLVAAAALSGSDVLSALLAAVAVMAGARPVVTNLRRDLVTQLASIVALVWLLYAAVVGSLPSPSAPGEVADWAANEGRALLALYAIAIGAAIRSSAVCAILLRRMVLVVASTLVVGLLSHWSNVSPPLFDDRQRRLFHGLTSSHHVAGFLGAAMVLVVVAFPRLLPRNARIGVVALGVVAIALAGSRSSLVGLAAGVVVVLAHLLDRRRFVVVVTGLTVLALLVMIPVPRFRQTIEIVVRPEFVSDAVQSFESGTRQQAVRLSDSTVEANMLIRFALWGEQIDVIRSSPLVGIGRFRGNDDELRLWGVDGVFYVAIDGERSPLGQPHNMYLYLLGETGIVGLLVFMTPYAVAVARTRRRSDSPLLGPAVDARDVDAPDVHAGDEHAESDAAKEPAEPTDDPAGGPEAVVTVGWTYWSAAEASDVVDPRTWRALSRGGLAVGLTIGLFSAALMTTGLGLVVNLIVFGAASAYAQTRSGAPSTGVETPA